ncbi:MAG: endo-1,4-beta-xylanase [Ignavibacteria bacterium]|jgi:GH35 family endo-1,4-beta-xylanase
MKARILISLLLLFLLFINVIPAQVSSNVLSEQEKSALEVTPEAIDKRISEIRMGDIIVKTKPSAEVKIEQVRHEFLFGAAIPNHLAENYEEPMSPEDREMFIKTLSENFNYAVHENALKWYDCEKESNVVDYSVADRIWEICDSLNIPMRGHCIYWAKDEFLMSWLAKLNNDDLRSAVIRRGTSVTEHFKGRINEFDLNNEMIHGDFFRRHLGYGVLNEMAFIVKAANPDAKLYVNDYGVLDLGYNAGPYIIQIKNLLANGVPIDGIGCQAHLSMRTTMTNSAEKVQRTLNRLAQFDLPIKITECLFVYENEQVQVNELNKLFPIYFAHPNVEAILMWGFWEKVHWQPHSAMWRTDWTPRPQALAYRDLVFRKWWTNITDKADKKGKLKAHAFYGDYKITSNGVTKKVTLSKKDKSIEVVF